MKSREMLNKCKPEFTGCVGIKVTDVVDTAQKIYSFPFSLKLFLTSEGFLHSGTPPTF